MVRIGEIWCCTDTDGNGLKTGLTVLTSLPVSLPGSARTAGFLKVGFSLPVSLPGIFPDLPGLRRFERNGFLTVSSSRFSSGKLPGLGPFAFLLET